MILFQNSNTQDLLLKRMLELFLTFLPLKTILQFQESILCFFFLNTKNTKNKKQPLEHMPDAATANLVLKRMLELFLKVLPVKKLELQNPKRGYEICPKSNQILNQWLKTYEMNFINKKTNKEKVLNFVLWLGRSWRAKKAPKLFAEYLVSFQNC